MVKKKNKKKNRQFIVLYRFEKKTVQNRLLLFFSPRINHHGECEFTLPCDIDYRLKVEE